MPLTTLKSCEICTQIRGAHAAGRTRARYLYSLTRELCHTLAKKQVEDVVPSSVSATEMDYGAVDH